VSSKGELTDTFRKYLSGMQKGGRALKKGKKMIASKKI
jgi:hypothetical protein